MAVKRRVDVTIMGLPLSVRTERDDAFIHGLANQLNRRLEEFRRAAPKATAQQIAVLIALNLAEELQGEKDRAAAARDDAADAVSRALDHVAAALSAIDHDDEDASAAVARPARVVTAQA